MPLGTPLAFESKGLEPYIKRLMTSLICCVVGAVLVLAWR